MRRKSKSLSTGKISFYNLLIIANWVVLVFVIFGIENNTLYTDSLTKVLSAVLCVIIHFVLKDARKNKNPLLCIVGFELIFFYQLGIFSIGWSEIASYLDESKVVPSEFNYALFFIICSTVVMWRAMHFTPEAIEKKIDKHPEESFKVMSVIVFVALALLFLGNIPGLSYVQAFFLLVFNVPGLLLFVFAFYSRNSRVLSKKSLFIVVAAALLLIIIKTLGGSRSGFLVVFMLLISALLVENKVMFKVRYVILGLLMIPVMVFVYTYSSFLRRTESTFSSANEKIEMASEVTDRMSGDDLRTIITPVIGRMSYIDGACVSIKLKDGFSSFINPVYCFKSTVDNVLTPGFDVFDTPRMSLCMRFYHANLKNVTKTQAENLVYQSDVFTFFGEQYVMLGGWLGLLGIYFICYYFKVLYVKFRRKDNYFLMAALVYLFSILFNSYGLDWFFLDVVSMTFSYYIYKYFVNKQSNKKKLLIRQSF